MVIVIWVMKIESVINVDTKIDKYCRTARTGLIYIMIFVMAKHMLAC